MHRYLNLGAAVHRQLLRQPAQRLDEVTRHEVDQGCTAAELAAHLGRGDRVLFYGDQPVSADWDAAANRFQQFGNARSEARESRAQSLPDLLAEPLPHEIRGLQDGQTQVLPLADDFDQANAKLGLVQFDGDRGHFDIEFPPGRGPVGRAAPAHLVRRGLRRAVCRRPVRKIQVVTAEPQKSLFRIAVRRNGCRIDGHDPARGEFVRPDGGRIGEEQAPRALDRRTRLSLDALEAGQQSGQEQSRAGQQPDEAPHDLHALPAPDARERSKLQAEADRRAHREHQGSDRSDRNPETQRRPHHEHERAGEQGKTRREARERQRRRQPAAHRQRPCPELPARGRPAPFRGRNEKCQQRDHEDHADRRVRPPAQYKGKQCRVHDQQVAAAADAHRRLKHAGVRPGIEPHGRNGGENVHSRMRPPAPRPPPPPESAHLDSARATAGNPKCGTARRSARCSPFRPRHRSARRPRHRAG